MAVSQEEKSKEGTEHKRQFGAMALFGAMDSFRDTDYDKFWLKTTQKYKISKGNRIKYAKRYLKRNFLVCTKNYPKFGSHTI